MTRVPSRDVLLATRSEGKLRELQPLLQQWGVRTWSPSELAIAPEPAEDTLEQFATFEENALAKARWFAGRGQTFPVIADDSGLEVEALDWQPGVLSKRWSLRDDLQGDALDDANNAHLLARLQDVRADNMPVARYVCAAACVWGTEEIVVRGVTCGVIVSTPRGRGGFGYDPYFLSNDLGVTFAEAPPAEKTRVSHRGRAFRMLAIDMVQRGVIGEVSGTQHNVPSHS